MKHSPELGNRRYCTRLRSRTVVPECTALIDVMFLLLLFIMMAGSVITLPGIKVDLPSVKAPSLSGLGKLIVTVTAPSGDDVSCIYFRDKMVTISELREVFAKLPDRQEQTVIIRADREVPSGMISEVIAVAKEFRLAAFLAVQLPDDKPETHFE